MSTPTMACFQRHCRRTEPLSEEFSADARVREGRLILGLTCKHMQEGNGHLCPMVQAARVDMNLVGEAA